MRLIHNNKLCFGCKACVSACKDVNNLPAGTMLMNIFEKELGEGERISVRFFQKTCLQCNAPACIEVCPQNAIVKDENGIVHIVSQKCMGCGKCQTACINNAISKKGGHMMKCELCTNNRNQVPACVQACPTNCIEVIN